VSPEAGIVRPGSAVLDEGVDLASGPVEGADVDLHHTSLADCSRLGSGGVALAGRDEDSVPGEAPPVHRILISTRATVGKAVKVKSANSSVDLPSGTSATVR
jgi:hypothetical protein